MNFLPDQDQQQIIDAISLFFSTEHPLARAVETARGKTPDTRELWQKMGQLGWLGISQDAVLGGSELSIVEEVLIVIEAGRNLISPCLFGSILGARVASGSGDSQIAAQIISGEIIVAMALPTAPASATTPHVNAQYHAVDLASAQYVLACDAKGAALIEKSAALEIQDQQCMDESLQLSVMSFDNTAVTAFVPTSIDDIYLRGTLLSTASLLGIAEQAMRLSIDYAKQREQFGRPIGSFQAIKHKCADMAVRCEAARATTVQASLLYQDNAEKAVFDCSVAKLLTAEAAINNAAESIQIHGGLGFTVEMPIHLLYKRAHFLSQLFATEHSLLSNLIDCQLPQ